MKIKELVVDSVKNILGIKLKKFLKVCKEHNISSLNTFNLWLMCHALSVGYTAFFIEKIIEVPVEKIVEKEIYITDDDEVKKLSDKNIELIEEVKVLKNKVEDKTKDNLITDLNKKIKMVDKTNVNLKDEVSNLGRELKELKEKLETSLKVKEKDDDIYKDGKTGGWFGSNLLKK
jgi:hypothetical protein